MTNDIRADAIDVTVFEKICKDNECKTNKVQSKLEKEIKLAILKKATIIEQEGFDKYYEKKGKIRPKHLQVNNKYFFLEKFCGTI